MSNKEENKELSANLEIHVHKLAQEIGDRSIFKYDKLEEAKEYIVKRFKSLGYPVEFQSYNVNAKEVKNIIAIKKGKEKPDQTIIVGAHYDTCFNPGADDNASGIAALLELASLFAKKENNRTIKFIAFVNEEPPFFKTKDMGSRVYTKAAKIKKENIKAALILESVGYYSHKPNSQNYPPLFGLFYPNKGNFICIAGNLLSHALVKGVTSTFKKHTRFPVESFIGPGFIPGVDFSDNWSFWQEGYPAVMITDTAFYRNPHYHTASDTYKTLDYNSISEVVRGLGEVLIELSE